MKEKVFQIDDLFLISIQTNGTQVDFDSSKLMKIQRQERGRKRKRKWVIRKIKQASTTIAKKQSKFKKQKYNLIYLY